MEEILNMSQAKEKIAIISRSFWPENPAIGEALLLLSEALEKYAQPVVITQIKKDFHANLKAASRGNGIVFATLPSITNSSSSIFSRVLELLLFTIFVFFSLCWHRPSRVYVATNPPLFTPLVVRWYCGLFGKKFVYHLQDIHPEATHVVTGRSNWVTRLLQAIDVSTTLKANAVITLTGQMKGYIVKRVGKNIPITLLTNPSVQDEQGSSAFQERAKGFVYCGNAGRLQRIPLLLEAIEQYINENGQLPFVFAGGGVHSSDVKNLAQRYEQVTYLGVLPGKEAAKLIRSYAVGLMPIEDEVTNYAFPSKSSSYAFSGCYILAICGLETSVAQWVKGNRLGFVVEPYVAALVNQFHEIEKTDLPALNMNKDLLSEFTPFVHAVKLEGVLKGL
ncbi:glycosyltransferase [Candidatus Njordibacter sp. Uisw_002]|uniref:glycosyltransferase n=1 Tax=Candidatus Njordibacter sp. Uisw_002 TaxID=3230971 RepID=UPI003D588CBC